MPIPGIDLHDQIPHSGKRKGFVKKVVHTHPVDGRTKLTAWMGTQSVDSIAGHAKKA